MKLTENQKRAVHFTKGNALINAGSGSGKTAVITARVANLIANENAVPSTILALTFTREATDNMRKRLKKMIGKKSSDDVQISTFHSFAFRIMKEHYPELYNGKSMMQGWWKMSKMYDIISKPTNNNNIGMDLPIRAGELGSFISYQKANMIKGGVPVVIDDNVSYVDSVDRNQLQIAFDTYCEHVRNARLIEFDDMLVDFYYSLKEDANFRETIKTSFEYVLVDEFQDTNSINLEIIKMITEDNLFVVGDFRQGIYGFINANIGNILDFTENFNDVEVVELSSNFRSTGNIVNFINQIIEKSPVEQYKKFSHQVPAREGLGAPINLSAYSTENEETASIIEKIIDEMDDNPELTYNDFAILTRTNAQIGMYESEFANEGVPVDVSTSRSFFDRKEIADLLAYATHSLNPDDDMSIRRIVNSPSRFISKNIIANIEESAYKKGQNFEEACHGFSGYGVENLIKTFAHLRGHSEINASKFLKEIYRHTRYEDFLNKTAGTHSELKNKIDSVHRLFELSKKFSSINAFLGHVSIIKSNNSKSKDGVKLMTVHASKGLEFSHVFVPSATEDSFPHSMCQDEEEERRLFYVACSRAKDVLSISVPVFSPNGGETLFPSPFLIDVVGDSILSLRKNIVNGVSRDAKCTYSKGLINV